MASASIGRIFIDLVARTDSFNKSMQAASKRLSKLGDKFTSVGKALTLGVTTPLAAAGAAAFKFAADAEEAANKFNVVFGKEGAKRMNDWVSELHNIMPKTTFEIQSMASGLQDLLVPLGVSPRKAEDLTKKIVTLAGDLASFNNLDVEDVMGDLQSGLVGNYEALQKYGVALNAGFVKQQAFAMGIGDGKRELTAQEKALVGINLIMERTTAAHGDMARTLDSTANSYRFMIRNVKELAITLGNLLTPIVTPFVKKIAELAAHISNSNPELLKWGVIIAGVAAAVGPLLIVFGALASALSAILALGAPVLLAIVGIGLALAAAGAVLYMFWDKVKPMWDAGVAFILRLFEALRVRVVAAFEVVRAKVLEVWAHIKEKFQDPEVQAAFEKLWALFEKVGSVVAYIVGEVLSRWLDIGVAILSAFASAVSAFVTKAIDLFTRLVVWLDKHAVLGGLGKMVDKIGEAMRGISSAFTSAMTWLKDAFGSFVSFVDGKIQYFANLIKKVKSMLAAFNAEPGSSGSPTGAKKRSVFDKRASGGPVLSNTPYLVGEKGPELFVPDGDGMIIPNRALSGGRAATGGNTVVNQNINITPGLSGAIRAEVLAMSGQLKKLAIDAVQEAKLNRPSFGQI